MKKERWIPMLVTAIVGLMMVIGYVCHPTSFNSLFGKGYESTFYVYTNSSLHAGDLVFCLTDDGSLVRAGNGIVFPAKLNNIIFDETKFRSSCTDYGYWQGSYDPDEICKRVVRAWYGECYLEFSSYFYYLLLMDNGALLCLEGYTSDQYPNGEFVKGYHLEPRCNQLEFFRLKDFYIEQSKDTYKYHNYPKDFYAVWKTLYAKYGK